MKNRMLLRLTLAVLTFVMMPTGGLTNDDDDDAEVHEGDDGVWTVSRANCINNESITQSLLDRRKRRVESLHMDTYEETDHTIESSPGYELGIRAAAIHWGEGRPRTIAVTVIESGQPIYTEPEELPHIPNDIQITIFPHDIGWGPPIVIISHQLSDVWIVVGTHYEKASPNQVRKIYTYATDCNWSDLD